MGKIDSLSFTNGDRKNAFYRPGDTIFGRVTFKVSGSISINAVRVYCYGAAFTKWSTTFQRASESDSRSKEPYFQKQYTLIDGSDQATLPEGSYSYPFRFELPNDNLPSSFEGELGAVRYWLKFRVDKSFPGIDFTRLFPFTVLAPLNVNDFKNKVSRKDSKTVSKALGIGNAGTLKLSASLQRGAFCPGEKILIDMEAKNDSTKDMGVIRTRLVQSSWFTVGKEDDTRTIVVKSMVTERKLLKNDQIIWSKHPFEVPAIPPTTKDRSCHIINVTYFLEIEVEVPMGFDLAIKLPVTIGTIPFGAKSVVSKKQHEDCSNYNRVGITKVMTYKSCTAGIRTCSKSDDSVPFPYMTYTPMTACLVASTAATKPTAAASASATTPRTPAAVAAPTPAKVPLANSAPRVLVAPSAPPPEMGAFGPGPMEPFPPQGAYGGAMPMPFPNEAPPSYDSIYTAPNTPTNAMNTPAPTLAAVPAQPTKKSVPTGVQKKAVAKTVTWNGTVIGVIFSMSSLPGMKDFLKKDKKMLDAHNGRLVAVFDEFQISPPAETAAILVLFDSETPASEWAKHLSSSSPVPNLQIFLAVNCTTGSSDVKDLSLFPQVTVSMSSKDPTITLTKEETKTFAESGKVFSQLRPQFGGKSLIISKGLRLIAGDWTDRPYSPDDVSMSISVWPTKALSDAYSKELSNNSDYKTFNQLYKKRHTSLVSAKTVYQQLD